MSAGEKPNTIFDDMEDDIPVAGKGREVNSAKANAAILAKRGFVRGAWMMVQFMGEKGQGIRDGLHMLKFKRAVKGDKETVIAYDPKSKQDIRLNLRQAVVTLTKKPTKKQTTRMRLIMCTSCDYKLRGSISAFEQYGMPTCPCGRLFELEDQVIPDAVLEDGQEYNPQTGKVENAK